MLTPKEIAEVLVYEEATGGPSRDYVHGPSLTNNNQEEGKKGRKRKPMMGVRETERGESILYYNQSKKRSKKKD